MNIDHEQINYSTNIITNDACKMCGCGTLTSTVSQTRNLLSLSV